MVKVQNPAPSMLDHKKAIEQLKSHRRYREEIESSDHLAMILQERLPALGMVAAAPNSA